MTTTTRLMQLELQLLATIRELHDISLEVQTESEVPSPPPFNKERLAMAMHSFWSANPDYPPAVRKIMLKHVDVLAHEYYSTYLAVTDRLAAGWLPGVRPDRP